MGRVGRVLMREIVEAAVEMTTMEPFLDPTRNPDLIFFFLFLSLARFDDEDDCVIGVKLRDFVS